MNSSDQDGDLKIGVAESLLDLAFNGAIPSIFRMHVVRERLISVPGLPFPKGTEVIC